MIDILSSAQKFLCPQGVSLEELQGKNLLAAVSGGIDSMVMLDVLYKLSCHFGFFLHVITVNHNIRPDEESAGDAALVERKCVDYGLPCSVCVLRKGLVSETSRERGKGIEEAARYLRYKAFDEHAKKIAAAAVCIAHNRNDRLETILQRFLQGAGVLSSSGMRQSRGIYTRPLFDVPRSDIEAYAALNGIEYRTDSTNADNSYFRNRIRNRLIPFLNELEPGWDSAVIHGAEKNLITADDINIQLSQIRWSRESDFSLRLPGRDFEKCLFSIKTAVLYEGLSILKCQRRIPYSMIADFSSGTRKVSGAGLIMERRYGDIFLSLSESFGTEKQEHGFYTFVPCPGKYFAGEESVTIKKAENSDRALYIAENEAGCVSGMFMLPVVIRSASTSDSFISSSGGKKLLSKIFSEWRVPPEKRSSIPVFEDCENRGVWGSLFGYPDWFVKI
ncbi:MAG: tRNA lysidine(34) synthetase TilS [Treponemataceae bacterium]|nr:tRNA lysidine(34) synthetase TilS [Treponemataceae bacterium]